MFLVLQLRNPYLTQSHKDLSEVFQLCVFTFRSMIELIFAWSKVPIQGQFFLGGGAFPLCSVPDWEQPEGYVASAPIKWRI